MDQPNLDAATMQALKLAAPWPTCHDCGEQHPESEPCYARGAFAVVRIHSGPDHSRPAYYVDQSTGAIRDEA